MNILVTGATGFLGSRLCEVLSKANYTMTATGRNARRGAQLANKNTVFIAGDLTDRAFTDTICRNAKAIIHCAALPTVWASYQDFYQANVLAVSNLIASANKHQIRQFIHVSTPSIYIGGAIKEQIKETMPLPRRFINTYAHTKKLAEDLLLDPSCCEFHPTIIRPQGIFGPRDQTIVPRLLATHDQGGIPLIRGGQHLIDLTYIDNVCDALLLCLRKKMNTEARIYNITNGEPVVFLDFLNKLFSSIQHPLRCNARAYFMLQLIARAYETTYKLFKIKEEPRITRYTLSILSESRTLDISAAKEELGYQPKISLDEGVQRYAQWYIHQLNTRVPSKGLINQ